MPRPVALAEEAVEAQVVIRDATRRCAPLYVAAVASGDRAVMAETKALADTLRWARSQARRIAGLGERRRTA